jgi:hypothetical protein
MTAAVYSFPVQRSRCCLFVKWCSAGWEEDDELRQDGGGVWQRWRSWRVTGEDGWDGVGSRG